MWMPRRLLHVDASAPTLSYLIFRSRYTVVPVTNKGPSTVTILAEDVSSSVNTTLIRPTIPPSTHCRRKPRIRLRCRHRPVSPRRGSPLPSAHRTGSWPATKPGKIANASTAIADRTTLPFQMGRDLTHYHSRSKIGGSGPAGQRVFCHSTTNVSRCTPSAAL